MWIVSQSNLWALKNTGEHYGWGKLAISLPSYFIFKRLQQTKILKYVVWFMRVQEFPSYTKFVTLPAHNVFHYCSRFCSNVFIFWLSSLSLKGVTCLFSFYSISLNKTSCNIEESLRNIHKANSSMATIAKWEFLIRYLITILYLNIPWLLCLLQTWML